MIQYHIRQVTGLLVTDGFLNGLRYRADGSPHPHRDQIYLIVCMHLFPPPRVYIYICIYIYIYI